jgi:hypothetical protein
VNAKKIRANATKPHVQESGIDDPRVAEEHATTSSLSQPDTLLTAEYLETIRRKSHLEPEKRLMLAILEDAVSCFQENVDAQTIRKRALFKDTLNWIQEERNPWGFSFENVCEHLEIDPGYLRNGMINWRRNRQIRQPRDKAA